MTSVFSSVIFSAACFFYRIFKNRPSFYKFINLVDILIALRLKNYIRKWSPLNGCTDGEFICDLLLHLILLVIVCREYWKKLLFILASWKGMSGCCFTPNVSYRAPTAASDSVVELQKDCKFTAKIHNSPTYEMSSISEITYKNKQLFCINSKHEFCGYGSGVDYIYRQSPRLQVVAFLERVRKAKRRKREPLFSISSML